MTPTIRAARAGDLRAGLVLLRDARLPVDDLGSEKIALVAEDDRKIRGIVGLESFGSIALLRSLVVAPDARGAGVGAALVAALELACAADGVDELWLLTIDAETYFEKLGYAARPRNEAPGVIRDTDEFSVLCPADAALMSKVL